jgi:hypothetical protein
MEFAKSEVLDHESLNSKSRVVPITVEFTLSLKEKQQYIHQRITTGHTSKSFEGCTNSPSN